MCPGHHVPAWVRRNAGRCADHEPEQSKAEAPSGQAVTLTQAFTIAQAFTITQASSRQLQEAQPLPSQAGAIKGTQPLS